MDFRPTAEQELIRSSAREFAEREIVPHARDWDRAEEIDRALVPKLAAAGYLGAGWEEAFGGSGLDTLSYALVVEELGKADSSVRGIVSVNVGLVGKTIARFATDEQKREWLPKLASGEALGCYALTEPGCGSDAAALVTRAERDGDGWVLSGLEDVHHARDVGVTGARLRAHRRRRSARHHVLPRSHRLRTASSRGRSRASSGCARRTPPSSRSTACACPRRTGSASSTAASASRCPRSTSAGYPLRPAASASRRAASTRASRTRASAAPSDGRSPASSSCRSSSPRSRSRPMRQGCSSGAPPRSPTLT